MQVSVCLWLVAKAVLASSYSNMSSLGTHHPIAFSSYQASTSESPQKPRILYKDEAEGAIDIFQKVLDNFIQATDKGKDKDGGKAKGTDDESEDKGKGQGEDTNDENFKPTQQLLVQTLYTLTGYTEYQILS